MASFPTPSQIQATYLQILKSLKPSLNINDQNSDFVLRGRAFTGLLSGLYGDQAKVRNDGFISTMRPDALLIKGQDLGIPQQPATPATSTQVRIFGTNGTVVSPGQLTFPYGPTAVLYANTTGGTIANGQLDLSATCQINGQVGNIQAPDTFTVVSPPTGVQISASILVSLADGSDIESTDSYRSRLLSREQNPPAGGNQTDYPNFAFAADPSVRSAFIRRFGRGLGTVDLYITTGTTDIDTAVTNGSSVVRIPSPTVLQNVESYLVAHVPLTDCPEVYAPSELPVNVAVSVVWAQGLSATSVPSDPVNNPLNLTCLQLVQREVSRVLYKLPVGGRSLPGQSSGVVAASDLEIGVDVWLSAVQNQTTGLPFGIIPILADRQIELVGTSDPYEMPVSSAQLPAPGTIAVTAGV